MSDNIKVSFVVPVYNVDQYLERCVHSLLSQTYPMYDIILVDDGSTDSSPQICENLEKEYTCIKTIHQQNGGLSSARNLGIINSDSPYIVLVDSDDYVDESLLERLVAGLRKYNADIVCSPLLYEYNTGKHKPTTHFEDFVTDSIHAQSFVLRGKFSGISACAKLFPRNLLIQIPYPVGKINEDLRTIIPHIREIDNVAFISYAGYHYVQRNTSITYSSFTIDTILETIKTCEDYMETSNCTELKNACIYRMFRMIIDYVKGEKQVPDVEVKTVQNRLRKYLYNSMLDKESRLIDKIKIFLLAENVLTFRLFQRLQLWNRSRFLKI